MNCFSLSFKLAIALAMTCGSTQAGSLHLQPVADTTLAEFVPENNLGGTAFVNAGTAGVNAGGARNRGLFKFDFSSLPANAHILSVKLHLEVTYAPANPESSTFALHRMFVPWGEGTKDSTFELSPGLGFPATQGEATWASPFALITEQWSAPGGEGDFSSTVSSRADVYGLADFPVFPSTPELVADVQDWLKNPASNFGWLLKTEAEDVYFTARRFGSLEFAGTDSNSPPYLEIEFLAPPVIFNPNLSGQKFEFQFSAEPNQDYVVESRTALDFTNAWNVLTNIPAQEVPTNLTISVSVSDAAAFYRIRIP